MFQCLCASRHLKGQRRVNISWRGHISFFRNPRSTRAAIERQACNFRFYFFFAHSEGGKESEKRRRWEPWGLAERTGSRGGKQLGRRIRWGCGRERPVSAPARRRRGRTERVVHQIFIWASVHSSEPHYESKAAENILEEQLNKNVAYL